MVPFSRDGGTIRYHFFVIVVPYGTIFSQKLAKNQNRKIKKAQKQGLFSKIQIQKSKFY